MAYTVYLHSPSVIGAGRHRLLYAHALLTRATGPKVAVNSQGPNSSAETDEPAAVAASPKKSASPVQGFGSSASVSPSKSSSASVTGKRRQVGKKERASISRRTPVEKPALVSEEEEIRAEQQMKNESAFLLAWLGLGGVILIQGIALAASGFLPEEWDKFFVKYLYPSFTPTVFLFVSGTVAYGVLKYLQNEQIKGQK
ncbi:hypothetical protein SAY87_011723 [Trapa incisa]|uniref:Protein LOW PSII ACCUMULATION 2, chloroplastic n=1 Tax=Trapa incisa TaxID=236973 RepID=A0AAN7GJP7_9MYRT|nr:hypothetical protein SAY87_011723 [Trapa incisa]